MAGLFKDKTTFKDDISNWDTSKVTTMYKMFSNANKFNQNISKLNISNLTNMNKIFYNEINNSREFNQKWKDKLN